MKLFWISFSSLLCLPPAAAFGAACCGGGFSAPALIVGDDRAKVTASYSVTSIASEVGPDKYWRNPDSKETYETFKLDAVHVFADRWQAGASLPVVRRARAGDSSSGLGDVTANLAYEYLPDWDYNPWRPRGLAFVQLIAPTGRTVNEAAAAYQLDSRGRGFWAVGMGTILTKAWGRWDAFASVDGHRSFGRSFHTAEIQGRLHPGFGANWGGGAGWNLNALRFGASLTWSYEDPTGVTGTVTSPGSPQRFATVVASASYLLSELWAGTFSYSDQTKFGSPINATLGRGVSLLLQRRWDR